MSIGLVGLPCILLYSLLTIGELFNPVKAERVCVCVWGGGGGVSVSVTVWGEWLKSMLKPASQVA